MSVVEHLLPIGQGKRRSWEQYLLDSALAVVGTMLVTGAIAVFQLYPRIPNISIVYLLVVLALASTRGRFASILASIIAFLSFDFFLVPPLYVFTISRIEEWIALVVFLVTAILTSQLAVTLRSRAEQSDRRERETRILYDLVRVTNREDEPERQLHAIALAIVDVFSSWGVHDCAILQSDASGKLVVQASAYQPIEEITISPDEKAIASWVMTHGRSMGLYDDESLATTTSSQFVQRVVVGITAKGRTVRRSLRLIPLKTGQQVVGVLRLRILDESRNLTQDERLEEEDNQPNARTAFFWTFLEQASSLIERARLRRENLRIEVLQRTDALRAALLSSVSHDLRTPLASIKAAASSLLQEDVQWDEETKRSFARSIEREADRLNRLVSNLLDMSRIEDAALKPEKELYMLPELVQDVLGRLKPLLVDRDVRTQVPVDLPPIELDYMQIDQVLTNLIENAVRYTPKDSPIEVSARCEGSYIVISVADRGPGIPAGDLDRIFDKFYRVLDGKQPTGHPSGSGLGLAVCKGLVEAHGGRIWAEPREGGGVVFSVSLPLGVTEEVPV
ncbi:MAG TPA: ATP-binding protein [Ktedonobacteraceae bacterium]|nr:ATP-binding protein [Ktedonobacteraceae bacterium]